MKPSCLSVLFFGNLCLVGCTFSFHLCFLLLFFLQLFVKISLDNHFAFLLFFFFRMVLFAASCTILQTSVHSSSGILLTRWNPLNLFITSSTYFTSTYLLKIKHLSSQRLICDIHNSFICKNQKLETTQMSIFKLSR